MSTHSCEIMYIILWMGEH